MAVRRAGKVDVFITNSQANPPKARLIADALRQRGKSVVLEEESLAAGEDWERTITSSLKKSRNVLMLVSPDSLASQAGSYQIGLVFGRARRTAGVNVVPVLLPGVEAKAVPAPLRAANTIDLSSWDDAAEAVVSALEPGGKAKR